MLDTNAGSVAEFIIRRFESTGNAASIVYDVDVTLLQVAHVLDAIIDIADTCPVDIDKLHGVAKAGMALLTVAEMHLRQLERLADEPTSSEGPMARAMAFVAKASADAAGGLRTRSDASAVA